EHRPSLRQSADGRNDCHPVRNAEIRHQSVWPRPAWALCRCAMKTKVKWAPESFRRPSFWTLSAGTDVGPSPPWGWGQLGAPPAPVALRLTDMAGIACVSSGDNYGFAASG